MPARRSRGATMPEWVDARYRIATGARPPRIFLARHGESEWNAQKRITGQADPLLTPRGVIQAQRLEARLRNQPLSAIYTSSLVRARDTAIPAALAHGLAMEARDALNEIHLGDLQGRFRDERDPEAQRLWGERGSDKRAFHAPGGETFDDMERRVLEALADILEREQGGVVLIVGHRNPIRVMLGALMRWSPETSVAVRPKGGRLCEIVPGPRPQMRTIRLDPDDWPVPTGAAAPAPLLVPAESS